MIPFKIYPATASQVPILLSIPHCGIFFPDELKDQYNENLIAAPDDTDWFVDQLYDFALAMGITIIAATHSRWVIDLNRDPESKPLYTDGRIITGLCPTTSFLGESIYKDKRTSVENNEVTRRREIYYKPYHQKIEAELQGLKSKFGKVLLWDCHSIRQIVPTIQKEKFPDMILGNADLTSASNKIIDTALKNLQQSAYQINHNHPFKGGYITRHFGKPHLNEHALQLEMTKVNYMDDAELKYDHLRAGKMQEVLKRTLQALINELI
jgi:N-formylglutamate deformylase